MRLLFGVSEEEIARLSEWELVDVLNRLLRAEGSRIDLPPTNIQTSLRIHDPDGGVDARVINAPSRSRWIPEGLSVWQFKSGKDHAPAKLEKSSVAMDASAYLLLDKRRKREQLSVVHPKFFCWKGSGTRQ